MDKKINTILFILGATLFNVLIAVVSFIILTLLYNRLIMPVVSEQNQPWSFSIIFVVSIAVSFIVYRIVLKFILTKIDAEKHFDLLFIGRGFRKK